MSVLGDTLAGIRRIMLLDNDVTMLKTRTDLADQRFLDHERRLTRIETVMEFARPRLPRD
jgi:hypothetical protein